MKFVCRVPVNWHSAMTCMLEKSASAVAYNSNFALELFSPAGNMSVLSRIINLAENVVNRRINGDSW